MVVCWGGQLSGEGKIDVAGNSWENVFEQIKGDWSSVQQKGLVLVLDPGQFICSNIREHRVYGHRCRSLCSHDGWKL